MKVNDCMSRDVRLASPGETMEAAAKTMSEIDAGVLPVGENDRLVGMLTDRDIAVRGVAQGKGPQTPVREVMSSEIRYCYEDDEVKEAAKAMGELKLRRLPVLDRDKRLVGIISLGDIARDENDHAGKALGRVSKPGGDHSQAHV